MEKDRKQPMGAAELPVGGAVDEVGDPHGDEPLTGAQEAELKALCAEKGEPYEDGLTRDEAQARIDALKDG